MRKSLWIMLAVMVVAVGAPNAHADSFTYDFTSTTAGATGSVEFTESSILTSLTTISSFTSDTFSNLLSLTIAPESGESCGFLAGGPCIGATFPFGGGTLTAFYTFSSNLTSTGTYDTNGSNSGTLVISEVSTAPEPSSVALMLLGVGLVFLLRKRNSRGHQLAA